MGSFSKGLDHDMETGEVRPDAYLALRDALRTGDVGQFDAAVSPGLGTDVDAPNDLLARFRSLTAGDRAGLESFVKSQGFLADISDRKLLKTGLAEAAELSLGDQVAARSQLNVQQGISGPAFLKETGESGFRLLYESPLAGLARTLEGVDPHALRILAFTGGGTVRLIDFPRPPAFSQPSEFAEMAELYWMALARDVPFASYATHPITQAAAQDLAENWGFYFNRPENGGLRTRAQNGGQPDTARLFRGFTFGDQVGPLVSQLINRPVPMGRATLDPRIRTARMRADQGGAPSPADGRDYLTNYDEWFRRQQGFVPKPAALDVLSPQFDFEPRLIRSGRDGGEYVHADIVFQEFLHACFHLFTPPQARITDPADMGQRIYRELDDAAAALPFAGGLFDPERTFSATNPYAPFAPRNGLPSRPGSSTQEGFITLGNHDAKSLVGEVARRALQAVWYQKWSIHRRLRPEEFAGRLHVHFSGDHLGGKHRGRYKDSWDNGYARQLQERAVLDGKSLLTLVAETNRSNPKSDGMETFLLPIAFPEGCPMHSAYGAGHASTAGACATLLKAFVDDDRPLTDLFFRADPNSTPQAIFRPIEPEPDGRKLRLSSLPPAEWGAMTIGGELNKLASNEALFRNHAGVHWRSDHTYSLLLGQSVAIQFLWDLINTYEEGFAFELRTFEGYRIRISKGLKLLESVRVVDPPPDGYPNLEGLYTPVWYS